MALEQIFSDPKPKLLVVVDEVYAPDCSWASVSQIFETTTNWMSELPYYGINVTCPILQGSEACGRGLTVIYKMPQCNEDALFLKSGIDC